MSTVDDFLNKKYVLAKNENMDEYFKALGLNIVLRTMIKSATPVIELTKSGDEYTYSSATTFVTTVTKFKPGVEVDKKTPDGEMCKSTVTIDGCTLHEEQKHPTTGTTTIDRTFGHDKVITVIKYKDIVARSEYKLKA